jgi:hypothetical protein
MTKCAALSSLSPCPMEDKKSVDKLGEFIYLEIDNIEDICTKRSFLKLTIPRPLEVKSSTPGQDVQSWQLV